MDDHLTAAGSVTLPLEATGGPGVDKLAGGAGHDDLQGGVGVDRL